VAAGLDVALGLGAHAPDLVQDLAAYIRGEIDLEGCGQVPGVLANEHGLGRVVAEALHFAVPRAPPLRTVDQLGVSPNA
jgi:hypothetical protein